MRSQEHAFYEVINDSYLSQKVKRDVEASARSGKYIINKTIAKFFILWPRHQRKGRTHLRLPFAIAFYSLFLSANTHVRRVSGRKICERNVVVLVSRRAATLNRAPQFSTCVPWCTCARVCASLCAVLAATCARVCIAPSTDWLEITQPRSTCTIRVSCVVPYM